MFSSKKGFTFIELALVIALLMIFVALSVPSWTRWFKQEQLDRNVRELVWLISQARQVAEEQKTVTSVDIDTTQAIFKVNGHNQKTMTFHQGIEGEIKQVVFKANALPQKQQIQLKVEGQKPRLIVIEPFLKQPKSLVLE